LSETPSRPLRPKWLEFRVEGKDFRGLDPDSGVDYRIGWCGNGSMSHYILWRIDNKECYFYVFIDEKCALYRSICAAEKRLVYKIPVDHAG
jgi:hypothetical protein